jgi:homoaconitase/3-isopropylmalate dehydratase large subunit
MAETETKKQPAKQPQAVKFYFPKNAKKSYYTADFSIQAEDHIYVVEPSNPKYKQIVKYLKGSKDNVANRGSVFAEMSTDLENTDRGAEIDKLIEMEVTQIRRLVSVGKDAKEVMALNLVTSKGQLIDMYLKQIEM